MSFEYETTITTIERIERKVKEPEKKKEDVDPPPLYDVILLNDDYTPMDFVVAILFEHFGHSESNAFAIMLDVHTKGSGVAGTYTKDIAETKAAVVKQLAQASEHPLQVTVQEK